MAFFDNLKKKYTELLNPVKKSLSDDTGWFRQGQFTPIKQIQKLSQTARQQQMQSPLTTFGPLVVPNFRNQQVQEQFKPLTQPFKNYANQGLLAGQTALSVPLQAMGVNYGPSQKLIKKVQDVGMLSKEGKIGGNELRKSGINTANVMLKTAGLANPALMAKSAITGGILNSGVNTYQNIKQKQPLINNLGQSFQQGMVSGMANAGTTRLTSGLVGYLSKSIPALKPLTDEALSKAGPVATDTLKKAIGKWLSVSGKKLFKGAVIETLVETPIWATLTQGDQEKFKDAILREAEENLKMNILFAGVDSALDAKTLAPIVKKSLDDAVTNYFKNASSPEGLYKQGGYFGGQTAVGYDKAQGKFTSLVDKKVRFEGDDSKARVIIPKDLSGNVYRLSQVMDHVPLYKDYPEFANMPITATKLGNAQAQFDGSKIVLDTDFLKSPTKYDKIKAIGVDGKTRVYVPAKDKVKSVILHEVQHAIQQKEGFAKGGNLISADFADIMPKLNKVREEIASLNFDPYQVQNSISSGYKVPDELLKKYRKWEQLKTIEDNIMSNRATPFQAYKRLAGENESVATQARMDLTPEQRARTPIKYDTPIKDQIVAYGDGTSLARQPIKTTTKINPELEDMFAPQGIGGEGVKGQSGLDTTTLQSPVKTTTELPTKILSTPNLKTDVSLPDSISRVKQEVTTNKGTAEVAKLTREPFSVATIADINKLKQVARSRAFLEGDIETLRKRGDLVNKVVEAIQEVRPDITNEADALDFALNFPTKSAMTVKRPVLSPQEKQIRFEKLKEETKWKKEFGEIVSEIEGQAEADKSLFKQTGATLTPRGYSNQQTKNIRIQSDASRRAELEANKYFKEISIPAYKQGSVNLGDRLPADELLKTSKDKVAFAYQRETIQRNIEDIFGKNSKMKSFVVDNITNNENKSTIFQNNLKTNLQKTFKDLGIKKGSRQDYAAADFIEGNLSLEQLKDYFPNNWQNIVKASNEGRTVYKNLLGQINQQLTRFGYDAIPERKNYVTHTTQLQTFADKIGNFLNLNSDELPRTMAGINMETKPGKKFFSFGLQRKGGSTHEGLITALEKYLPSASRQIYHTEDIQRGRAILDFLQRSADEGDTRLSGFTSYFSQYVDHLAGKQNIIDRPVEKILGRKFLEIGDWVRKRTGANMVGGNLSSAATNFIPFTQSAATTSKPAFARGLLESALNFGKNPSTVDGVQSGFLLRRFAKERITGTLGENIKDTASLPFKLVDKFTSTSIVAGKYFEQLKKGLSKEKAMAVADDYAQRVMADRSFGQSPLLFNSRVLGALTQFQLEVNNQMSFLAKDIPKNMGYSKSQIASSLVQFGIYAYIFNNLYEKVMGRRPQIDLIQAAISTQQGLAEGQGLQAFNPMNQEGKGFSDRTGTGQILNQLPFTSIGGGRLPIASAFTNPQYFLLPPLGGGQIKKTVEGLGAYNKGYSETDKGNVRYPIKKDTSNLIKTAAFGQYAVPEAQKYFSEGRKPLSDTASTTVKNSSNITTSYNLARGKSDMEAKVKVVKDRVKTTGQEETFNGKKYYVGSEFDSKTGESTPVVKSVKVSQSTSDVYQNLDKQYETSEDSPKNILQKVKVYGTGIFKDPKGTLEAIKSGQPIRKVRGDAVVVERLKNLSSLDQGDKATEVDHVIAVALGGSNNESNLQVISKQDNRAKGVVDTYLAKELEAGRITKKEAQERDLNWRQEINTLPASEKAKAQKILSENPIKITTTTTNTLESLASREYEPIKTDSGYSNIQLKLPEPPKLTGQTELDKQLKSKYSSALSTYKTNIGKLYLDGQLTAEEANKALTEISNKKISVSKSKKPKKVTFKKPKVIKLKAVKIKYAKIKMPKIKKVKAYKRPRIKKMAVKRVKLKLPK